MAKQGGRPDRRKPGQGGKQTGKRGSGRADKQAAARRAVRGLRPERQRRAILISSIAVAALLVVGILGIGVWLATRPDPDAAIPPSATSDEHGLAVGTGPVPVEIYLDFMCPACQQFDAASRPILEEYLAEGTVTVIYRPIAILNRYSTTRYSTRAAAAAGCAADAGQLDPYVAALFTNQPQQGGAGLSDDQLVELGNSVGLGEEFAQCVRDGTYHDWAKLNTDAAADRGVQATPTVFVDGQRLDPLSLDALTAAIDRAAAGS